MKGLNILQVSTKWFTFCRLQASFGTFHENFRILDGILIEFLVCLSESCSGGQQKRKDEGAVT